MTEVLQENSVFISYKRNVDDDFARGLAHTLKKLGHNIWIDVDNIPVGSDWDLEIENNLNESKNFIVILSPESVKSKHVRDEISRAIGRNMKIIPVMIRECKAPLNLERVQYIECYDNKEDAIEKIHRALGGKPTITKQESDQLIIQKETMGLPTVLIGILSILLPLVMVVGTFLSNSCHEILNSISAYYYTNMRDAFVAFNCVLAATLISYRGYINSETVAVRISGVSCLVLTFFPTSLQGSACYGVFSGQQTSYLYSSIHYAAFSIFFIASSYYPLFMFSKKSNDSSPIMHIRSKIHRFCGLMIVSCVILIASLSFFDRDVNEKYHLVFSLETIAYMALGITWLVKSKALFNPPPIRPEFSEKL